MEIKPRIEVYIDQLVLHGFSTADKYRIALAVQQHLTTCFQQQGLPSTLQQRNDVSLMNGGSFQMSSGDSAGTIGNQIAGAVYSGFKPE